MSTAPEHETNGTALPDPRRILVADDDSVSRRLLEMTLKASGYGVDVATDGLEAWDQLLQGAQPRLVVLDWMMPGLDGTEVCRRIRASPALAGSHVILLTARALRPDVVTGLEAGADDYLTKPFDRPELLARVRAGARILALQGELSRRLRDMEEALRRVQTLEGLLPICSFCKRIRTEETAWQQVEEYVSCHSNAEFTHGICPDCLARQFET